MKWRLKCSERWSNVCSIFCASVFLELLLSMCCLISADGESSNTVNGRSLTNQHWKFPTDGMKVEVQWEVIKRLYVLYSVRVCSLSYCFLRAARSVQLESLLTKWMEDPSLTNTESSRRIVWRLKCSERSHVCSIFCASVFLEVLLSKCCLISEVGESSNKVNGRSLIGQHWKFQTDGMKVEVKWKMIKHIFYTLCERIPWVIDFHLVLVQYTLHLTVFMDNLQLTNIERADGWSESGKVVAGVHDSHFVPVHYFGYCVITALLHDF